MNAYFYLTAPVPASDLCQKEKRRRKGVRKRSEKMAVNVSPKIVFMAPTASSAEVKPQGAQADFQQEQFTGPVPARQERSMAEILKERLAEADPSRPAPIFVP
jgi:hypothetical protein